jgi:hypothetical protein
LHVIGTERHEALRTIASCSAGPGVRRSRQRTVVLGDQILERQAKDGPNSKRSARGGNVD